MCTYHYIEQCVLIIFVCADYIQYRTPKCAHPEIIFQNTKILMRIDPPSKSEHLTNHAGHFHNFHEVSHFGRFDTNFETYLLHHHRVQ